MTERIPATPSPGPLEGFAASFDDVFAQRAQRESFRRYLEGLLLPMERNKTLTGLANTEPITGAQRAEAQKLQWFLSESSWDPAAINQRRLEVLRENKTTAATAKGILAIDETGDRKWGSKTAHIGRQYLSNLGKVDNGIVSVETVWADERLYYPLEVEPYTPRHWFEGGQQEAAFRTKPEIALELVRRAVENNVPFWAVVADSAYGENEALRLGLRKLEVGYVMTLHRSHTWWHKAGTPGSATELARGAAWHPDDPGHWQPIPRRFRDDHTETWWALETTEGPYGPDQAERLVIVTTDPTALPDLTTWHLITNLPAPKSLTGSQQTTLPPADLAEIVRLYGLRIWIEQTYKQVKQHLGWAQYQVRSDLAIRRHWQLVCCAFSFCWWTLDNQLLAVEQALPSDPVQPVQQEGEKKLLSTDRPSQLAHRSTPSAGLAHALSAAPTLLACLVRQAASAPAAAAA